MTSRKLNAVFQRFLMTPKNVVFTCLKVIQTVHTAVMPLRRKFTVVGSDRRVWQHLQLSLKFGFAIFCEMVRQKPNKGVKMLSPVEKARILSWREEGVSVDVIAERLGRHRSAIFRLLNKAKNLPLCKFLRGKRALEGQKRSQAMPSRSLSDLSRKTPWPPPAT